MTRVSEEQSRKRQNDRAGVVAILCLPFTQFFPQLLLTAGAACGWTFITHLYSLIGRVFLCQRASMWHPERLYDLSLS
ncbi:hypothetical protein GCG54_00004728 [Colletotrichum gloeosporioides]|uniref:Uncharacterized protein n=1 Tax=Colletotrichum gloeosporioides TaxID=474922 RepID=A0A8H4CGX4_COLGL|nr:uncharacterized protein GCG54_00004728 [Colletotrichum gloeosporioides]KAF3803557.1 hypothetical protein GCG54_00004728 [Colletotrichum gloeosporioides]